MITWGKRKNGQAYTKNKRMGIQGSETSPVSDIHLKEKRTRPDIDRMGYRQSMHDFDLDNIEYGKTILEKMQLVFQKNYPEYSIIDELNRHDERVRDGVLEVLGRDADKIEQFIDYRMNGLANDKNPKWIMAIPLYGNEGEGNYRAEDSLAGMFQTEGYKHKLRITKVSPRKFLEEWVPPKYAFDPTEGYNRKVIENIKQSLRDKKPVETPFISVDANTGQVTSHEGRHRANAALELGIQEIPVWVTSREPIDAMTEKEKETFFSDNYIREPH